MSKKTIGEILELGGLGFAVAAAVQSVHHLGIAACIGVGAVLLYVGHKVVQSAG